MYRLGKLPWKDVGKSTCTLTCVRNPEVAPTRMTSWRSTTLSFYCSLLTSTAVALIVNIINTLHIHKGQKAENVSHMAKSQQCTGKFSVIPIDTECNKFWMVFGTTSWDWILQKSSDVVFSCSINCLLSMSLSDK